MAGKRRITRLALVLLIFLGLSGLAAAQNQRGGSRGNPNYQVFAFNDLGMHCYDNDFSVFSLLPPFNVIHGQVVKKEILKPTLLSDAEINLTYSASPYMTGSRNTTSIGKTNFWNFIEKLFGLSRPPDVGILGAKMPDQTFGPQPLTYGAAYQGAAYNWFSATGIPLTNIDDVGRTNNFTMMNIRATDKRFGSLRSMLDIVVPCSSEMNCASCHETAAFANYVTTFSDASPPPRIGPTGANLLDDTSFSSNPNPDIRFRENILILHDALGSYAGSNKSYSEYIAGVYPGQNSLYAVYQAGTPILCANCHYSKALDLAGTGPGPSQADHLYLSRAMHKHHGTAWLTDGGMGGMGGSYTVPIPGAYDTTMPPSAAECYYCHPGNDTQCLRSVMAVKGVCCQNCHGDLLAIAGFNSGLAMDPQNYVDPYVNPTVPNTYNFNVSSQVVKLNSGPHAGQQRQPWADMPKCQSCHSGDAINYRPPSIIGINAYDPNDDAATPYDALTPRFAENSGQLYRFSSTHGGMACESCHGSPHAEWPARINTNDNITATEIQGHTGEIAECGACHLRGLTVGLGGPHGLHNVNDPTGLVVHGFTYWQNQAACQACHGLDLKGTALSRANANRNLRQSSRTGSGGKITIATGTPVDCYACHNVIAQPPQ